MRSALRCVWPCFLAVLLVVSACSTRDSAPRRLAQRLKAVVAPEEASLSPDEVQQALARQMRVAPVPAEGGDDGSSPIFPTRETLADFYASNGQRLAWSDDSGKLLPPSETLLEALRRAGEHGLEPEDYALSRVEQMAALIGEVPLDDAAVERLADFDLLMTSAFLRYASDLSTGRVHPDEIRADWHAKTPDLGPLTKLRDALVNGDLTELLAALPPPHPGYARLREALQGLREVQAAGGWPVIPDGPKLKPGSRGPRVALLRQRLVVPGWDESGAPVLSPGSVDSFDKAVAEAVRRFQTRHGLEPDGKVGADTLAELNVPVERRIRQVVLNLERWRWIPRVLGDPHVVVNIPGFDLALVRNGVSVWRTRIVAGKAYTPTPVLSDRIVAVSINPPWNVPETIALEEYLPELQKDPKEFARQGFRLLEGSWEDPRVVDPKTVDLQSLDAEHFPYRIRQDPGPDNALGRMKFHLTNDFGIYLHDTPARSLFNQSGRDLSHGCIRVEKPLELAAQLLDEESQVLLQEAWDGKEERRLPVKPPMPIQILYLTAWVEEAGDLRFGPDPYHFDGPQGDAMDRLASRLSGGPASGVSEAARPPAN